ncbi:MAG: hypothetical protein AB7F23_05270 [Phycisphaerae bacterium]|jgi:hypothetical protein
MNKKGKEVLSEIVAHSPFTLCATVLGVLCMFLYSRLLPADNGEIFHIFHPAHVVLSSWATTILFVRRETRARLLKVFIIGYLGSVGIATLSDCILPFAGEEIMGISVPVHGEHGRHGDEAAEEEAHEAEPLLHRIHIGFIEQPILVNLSAFAGIAAALIIRSHPKLPHFFHVLVSVWASMGHIMMNASGPLTALNYLGAVIVIFFAVLLPCCVSDIVFPTLAHKP